MQRDRLTAEWLDPAALHPLDATTWSAETHRDSRGRYRLQLSHFFTNHPADVPRWQVVVDASAPLADHTDVQKIVNDILSQTS